MLFDGQQNERRRFRIDSKKREKLRKLNMDIAEVPRAVGPVGGPNGLLNPCPEASDAPMRPISQPKLKLSSELLNL